MDKNVKMLYRFEKVLIAVLVVFIVVGGVFLADQICCMTFHKEGAVCEKIGFITHEERFRDEEGRWIRAHNFTDLQNGDILISSSTHSLGWRHGHAGIVVDASKGTILEAALWGQPSEERNISHWRTYANGAHYRIKEETAEEALRSMGIDRDEEVTAAVQLGKAAAEFALENENGITYGLLAGFGEKWTPPEELSSTQCAHLVWYAYYAFGVDIDGDGGSLVTPKDIVLSESVELIEEFGNVFTKGI